MSKAGQLNDSNTLLNLIRIPLEYFGGMLNDSGG